MTSSGRGLSRHRRVRHAGAGARHHRHEAPPCNRGTARLFNGPGNNGASIRNGATYQLKPGDVVIIPAGAGHWFTKIDDHIPSYLMVRIDPDKVTPVRDETESQAYLKTTR